MSPITEAAQLIVLLTGFAVVCGALGGAIGYTGARLTYARITRYVEVEVEVQAVAARIVAPVQIDLRVNVPTMEPICVPVEAEIVNHTPNVELTRRLLDEAPQLGPRALSRIFQCSTSTAQTYYVQSAKAGGANVTPAEPLNLIATEAQA
jgi:hypothetical protein